VVQYLVDSCGVDLDMGNEQGDTPLMVATYEGRVPIVEYLIQRGADTMHKNKLGLSAAVLAAKGGQQGACVR